MWSQKPSQLKENKKLRAVSISWQFLTVIDVLVEGLVNSLKKLAFTIKER
jgi:hypothetical protein